MLGLFLWKIKKILQLLLLFKNFQKNLIENQINEIMARKNDIEMYSTHNEGKSVVDGRFIKTLKNKIYKYTTSISKNVSIDKLDDIVNKYNNTYHSTIKIKPVTVNVKSNTYTDSSIKINNEDPTFNIHDNLRISKYKNIFAKGCYTNWSVEVFVIKKVKNTVLWTCY